MKEYNKLMGGVDLLDMLTSISQGCEANDAIYISCGISFMLQRVTVGCYIVEKVRQQVKSIYLYVNSWGVCRSLPKANFPINIQPITWDVRKDGFDHFPKWSEKRVRCKFCAPRFTYVVCMKCEVALCFNKDRNCFLQFHSWWYVIEVSVEFGSTVSYMLHLRKKISIEKIRENVCKVVF